MIGKISILNMLLGKNNRLTFFCYLLGLNRKNIVDQRVHCCLYFIPPYGHGLRQIDLEFLKRLQYKVNLVPVIGKADTLTKPEVCYRNH